MASKNDETSGMAMGLGLIAAGFMLIALFVFAVLAFVALGLTILCFIAWNTPLKLGKFVLEPREARVFVSSGLAGSLLLPAFAAFTCLLFNINIVGDYWAYLFIGGYVIGSLGVTYVMAQAAEVETVQQPAPPPLPVVYTRQTISPPKRPFEFASWDDEEER